MSIEPETRSFAPPTETTPMKFTRVSETKPSMRSLARGQNALHDCLDAHIGTTAKWQEAASTATDNLASRQSAIADDVRDVKADVADLKKALRIGDDGVGRSVATQKPWIARVQLASAIAGGLVGAFAFIRFIVAAWPGLWHAILTTP